MSLIIGGIVLAAKALCVAAVAWAIYKVVCLAYGWVKGWFDRWVEGNRKLTDNDIGFIATKAAAGINDPKTTHVVGIINRQGEVVGGAKIEADEVDDKVKRDLGRTGWVKF